MEKYTLLSNATAIAFKPEQFYPAIPPTWILGSLEVLGCAVTISYLRSKPPLSQTVMDYANKIFFIFSAVSTVLMSIFITLAVVSSDCGEALASIIGYTGPASMDTGFAQLCSIFIIQAIMARYPELLVNNTFENIIKCIMGAGIPLCNAIIYTILYFVADPTEMYTVLRGIGDQEKAFSKIVRACIYFPLGFASTLILLYTIRMQQNNFIQPNHILNAKAVIVSFVGQSVIRALLNILLHFQYSGLNHDTTVFLITFVLLVIKSVFHIVIVLIHNDVRAYMSNLYPISGFTALWSLRQVRQIDVNQRDVELHGVETKRNS